MTTERVLQFMRKTAEDASLRQHLEILLGVGDGDISSKEQLDSQEAEALKGERGALVVELVAKHGFEFSVSDLITVVDAVEKHKAGGLSDTDFAKVPGLENLTTADQKNLQFVEQTVELVHLGRRYRKTVSVLQLDTYSAITDVLQFMEKTAEDTALRQELESLLGVGDGDISSAAELDEQEAKALKGEHGALVVKLASQYGFQFTVGDLITVVDAFAKCQSGDLSDDGFTKITGAQVPPNTPYLKQAVKWLYKGGDYNKFKKLTFVGTETQSSADVLKFMQKSAHDSQLQTELESILGVGDGDISSKEELDAAEAEALKGERGFAVVQLAAKHGCQFSLTDLVTVVDAVEKHKSGELSEESFQQLLGSSNLSSAPRDEIELIEQTVELVHLGRRYQKTVMVPKTAENSTPAAQVMQFMRKTSHNEALKREVESLLGVGDGDISSVKELDTSEAAALKGEQGEAIVALAAKQGYQFSVDDLVQVVGALESHQAGKLSDKDLGKIVGDTQADSKNLPILKQAVAWLKQGR